MIFKVFIEFDVEFDEIFSRELDFEPFSEKILEFFLRISFGECLEQIFLHKATSALILAKSVVALQIRRRKVFS